MRLQPLVGALALLESASFVLAQGQAQWLWTVETDDADAIVEPGESATITLSMLVIPEIQENYAFLGGAFFDTLGQANAAKGSIASWQVLNDLNVVTGETTTTDGVSLFGTSACQLFGIDPYTLENPVEVLELVWTTDNYTPYLVEYQTSTASIKNDQNIEDMIDVYTGPNFNNIDLELWPVTEATIAFQVIPAPATLLLILAPTTLRFRRPIRRAVRTTPAAANR